jgi:hypothetical protein
MDAKQARFQVLTAVLLKIQVLMGCDALQLGEYRVATSLHA